jgi:AAA+ ATPase superfamily predicted ATPase
MNKEKLPVKETKYNIFMTKIRRKYFKNSLLTHVIYQKHDFYKNGKEVKQRTHHENENIKSMHAF